MFLPVIDTISSGTQLSRNSDSLRRVSSKGLRTVPILIFGKLPDCYRTTRPLPNLVEGSSIVTSDVAKAELLNSHFVNSFNKDVQPLPEGNFSSPLPESGDCELEDLFCTEEEIHCLLAGIDSSKSSGPDSIAGRMLKSTAAAITPAVTRLFNKSLTLGKVPRDWKIARVTPIPKSSDKTLPSNYRPVSLLSILSKLLEKHLQQYLLNYLEECNAISDHQWGFLKDDLYIQRARKRCVHGLHGCLQVLVL